MIKKLYLLPLLLLTLSFIACNETEEVGKYDNWQARNEAFIDSLQQVYSSQTDVNRTLYRVQDSKDKKSFIYYKVIERGPTTGSSPFYTSNVTMYYRGMLLNEGIFSTATAPNYFVTELYNVNGIDIFDQNFKGADPSSDFDTPTTFVVNEVVRGWTEVLQLMRPGDRFEIYIPHQSGYGETTSSSGIPGYSTLIFDMQMVSVELYPKTK